MAKKKVIVSACLLGENCRYDGNAKISDEVIERYKDCEIIPFCPEAPIFGTPRERISIIEVNSDYRTITDDTNRDVTKLLKDEINFFINSNPEVDEIVLKSKSPSCGLGTTPILNQRKEVLFYGDGVAAGIFKKRYKNTKIKDEKSV